ncbi:Chromatin modification-related protein Eaf7/MRGBP [Trinorchestia longiramus]|nr:Chromatin modification-related protein Eaf7/MRGBP [Trinorchestia longiramus]
MTGHKPIGINKHFQMLMIHSKLSESLHAEVSSRIIWEKLQTLYDLTALEDSDKQQFPIADGLEFTLPSDYLQNVSPFADTSSTGDTSNITENTPSQPNLVPTSDSSSTITSRQTPSRSSHSNQCTSAPATASTKGISTSSTSHASRGLSSSVSGHRHSSPYSSRFTSSVNSPSRAQNGKDPDQHTPKARVHSRVSNESKDGTPTPSSRRRPNVEEASDDATPRRPKRGRDSKSGSPVPGSASLSKRRKV